MLGRADAIRRTGIALAKDLCLLLDIQVCS
jgi:hypothetical protein